MSKAGLIRINFNLVLGNNGLSHVSISFFKIHKEYLEIDYLSQLGPSVNFEMEAHSLC